MEWFISQGLTWKTPGRVNLTCRSFTVSLPVWKWWSSLLRSGRPGSLLQQGIQRRFAASRTLPEKAFGSLIERPDREAGLCSTNCYEKRICRLPNSADMTVSSPVIWRQPTPFSRKTRIAVLQRNRPRGRTVWISFHCIANVTILFFAVKHWNCPKLRYSWTDYSELPYGESWKLLPVTTPPEWGRC